MPTSWVKANRQCRHLSIVSHLKSRTTFLEYNIFFEGTVTKWYIFDLQPPLDAA